MSYYSWSKLILIWSYGEIPYVVCLDAEKIEKGRKIENSLWVLFGFL